MWCQHCGQDVPTLTAASGVPSQCPRCQQKLNRPNDAGTELDGATVVEPSDEFRVQMRMKHIGRSLRVPLAVTRAAGHEAAQHWIDLVPQDQPAATPRNSDRPTTAGRNATAGRASERRLQVVAWLSLVFGLGLVAGGVGLMGMGMFGEYPIFWQWGVGVTLAGQAILIAGLVKVLMSLWGSSRAASRRLFDMQQELAEVGRTAEAIIAQRPGGASGFYGELARGASPALLLANLKGQLDHLATRLHHDV